MSFEDGFPEEPSAGVEAPVPAPEAEPSSSPGLNETRSFDFVRGALGWGRRTTGPVSVESSSAKEFTLWQENVRKRVTAIGALECRSGEANVPSSPSSAWSSGSAG